MTAGRVQRRGRTIADEISRSIVEGGLTPGTQLPGSFSLAKSLGVSRPTIREALVRLEMRGQVEVRSGSGVFVCNRKSAVAPLPPCQGPFEILRARIVVERATAGNAATLACATQLLKIEQILQQMRRDQERTMSLDRQFHLSIAELSKNRAVVGIVESLWSAMYSPRHKHVLLQVKSDRNHELRLTGLEAVFAALVSHNPRQASQAMKRHLQALESHLFEV